MPVNLYPVPISHLLRWCSRAFEGRFWNQAWEKLQKSVGRTWTLTLTFAKKTFAEKMWPKDDSPQTRRLIAGKQDDPLEPLSEPTTPEPAEKQPPSQPPPSTLVAAGATDRSRGQPAIIGESLALTGTLSGFEDVYIDGKVEGAIDLQDGDLTIGPPTETLMPTSKRGMLWCSGVSAGTFSLRSGLRSARQVLSKAA